MTAWNDATNGDTRRMVTVYEKTLDRAKARGLIGENVTWEVQDSGFSMMVVWSYADRPSPWVRTAYVYTPNRDHLFGFFTMPPPHFKAMLRSTMTRSEDVTLQ